MTNLPTISQFFQSMEPFTVGFDEMFRRLEDFPLSRFEAITYPPYNVRKEGDNHYVVELAVAGFGQNDLDITMEDGTLTISGKVQAETETEKGEGNYLYKGIAGRAFRRSFSLADTVEIKNAELINGMLKVYLENLIPLSKKPKKIAITNGKSNGETKDTRQLLNEGDTSGKNGPGFKISGQSSGAM